MPKVNLPMGSRGIFIPAIDGAWASETPIDPTILAPGVWVLPVQGEIALNLTKFLQQFVSPTTLNAVLGDEFASGILTGFDIVYMAAAATTVIAGIFETPFFNGQTPIIKNATNTPQFVLTPANPIPIPQSAPASAAMVVKVSLADYWLIGQNLAGVMDMIDLNFAGPVNLLGVTVYFGQ